MRETWRDIPDYEGRYQVSNLGRVRSLPRKLRTGVNRYRKVPGKILTVRADYVALSRKGVAKRHHIGRLVLSAFMPNVVNTALIIITHDFSHNYALNNISYMLLRDETDAPEMRRMFTPKQQSYLQDQFDSGVSIDQLASEFYVSSSTVRKYIDPMYSLHKSIVQRCTNPNAAGFKHYGGRGIFVCDEWRKSV